MNCILFSLWRSSPGLGCYVYSAQMHQGLLRPMYLSHSVVDIG